MRSLIHRYLVCREKGRIHRDALTAREALATSSLISISASPHLNTYLDTPTQLPDRAMRPQISPED
jgi:hypothetical protein